MQGPSEEYERIVANQSSTLRLSTSGMIMSLLMKCDDFELTIEDDRMVLRNKNSGYLAPGESPWIIYGKDGNPTDE